VAIPITVARAIPIASGYSRSGLSMTGCTAVAPAPARLPAIHVPFHPGFGKLFGPS